MKNQKRIFGWTISIIAAIMPAWGVIGKFTNEQMQTHMTSLGYGDWLNVIAIGELIAVVLFLIPKTGRVGILLISALMGGAIAAHMGHNESFVMQSIVLILAWIATFIRYPEFIIFNTNKQS